MPDNSWVLPIVLLGFLVAIAAALAQFFRAPKLSPLRSLIYVMVVGTSLRGLELILPELHPVVAWTAASILAGLFAKAVFALRGVDAFTVGAAYVVARFVFLLTTLYFYERLFP